MEDFSDESSDATYIVSPSSDPPNREAEVTRNTQSDPTSVYPDPEDFLTPTSSRKSTGVSLKHCHICWKEFTRTSALDMHLLIHRQEKPHTCDICQREFKQHQLMSHMLTHQNKKTYRCTYSGCHKTYTDRNTLKHHCALRHGVYLTSPFFDHPSEPVNNHAVSKQQSYTTDFHGLFNSPQKPASPHVPNFPSNTEDKYPPHVKPTKSNQSGTLATASTFYEVSEREMQTCSYWAPVPHKVEENPVISQVDEANPLNAHGYESGPDFPDPPYPKRVMAISSVSRPSVVSEAVYSKKYLSIMLKNILKPRNKLKRKRLSSKINHAALLRPEPKSGVGSDRPDPVIRTPSPAPLPESRKRKYNSKDSEAILSDGPASPLPVLQTSPKRSRRRSPHLVSHSQVSLASFSTSPRKQFLSKESTVRTTGQEQRFCNRTNTRRPALCRTQPQSSFVQEPRGSCEKVEEHTSQPCSSTLKDKGQKEASGQKQKLKVKNTSHLIIPVSVPLSSTKSLSSKTSSHLGERSQTRKGLSMRSHHLTPLSISSPPKPYLSSPQHANDQETRGSHRRSATGGHSSQLCSPTFMADHRMSPRFHPLPYTPPPMLSPHRHGSGLYFNTLLQYPVNTYNASLDNVSTVDNTIVNIKPRINVGARFQAEIPPLRDTFYMLYEEHPAHLVWSPWKDLTTSKKTQKKVTELLDMCCSSVLTGGGTNIELALHCLHQVQGNIPAALDLLLMREDFRTSGHPLNDYHYTGSDHWTDQEMRLFRKALEDNGKDFHKIHNVLQTKSVAQCVEYYYIMKNVKMFRQRHQAAEDKDCGATSVSKGSQEPQPEQKKVNTTKRNTRGSGVHKRCPCDQSQEEWLPPGHKNTSRTSYRP